MSFVLDLIIALIIGITVFLAVKNGFIKTVISAAAFFIAIIVTVTFSGTVAEFMKATPIADGVTIATENAITNIIKDSSMEITELVEGESTEFNKLISIAGIEKAELKDWYLQNLANDDNISLLAEKIANPVIDILITLIAVLTLYIGTQVLLSIAASILDKIARLPVLNSFNKAGGLIIGVVLALLRVLLFCFVFDILIENSDFIGSDFISSLNPDNTLLFKIFRNINLFDFFIK